MLGQLIPEAVEKISPSVVSITSTFAPGRGRSGGPAVATGTGLAVHAAGYLVTNGHVVAGAARVSARLHDGRSVDATVLGSDPATDIALLLLPGTRLVPAPLGDSERVRAGEPVVAIGHSLGLPGTPTVSFGVVSARHRPMGGSDWVLEGLLQTDAAVNPGNSGGPLVTLTPEVIGINTAMVPYAQGVGFAVPVNTVRLVFRDLIDYGRVLRPWIGVVASPASRLGVGGVQLLEVQPQGPAAAAGLRAGDLLVEVGLAPVTSLRELLSALRTGRLGSHLSVRYLRGETPGRSELELREAPLSSVPSRVPPTSPR
ncbi:MAG: trypsin-like peptidase domain-containing protein [Thermoplasmata archaeon]|nr:trypsin-like peptidase domain-containing protein [Thermoplasmata archaeon]MCI4341078.1 trypsin-like peptidase domain-containing protein [Thermoplasmata archaeon]